MDAMTGLILFWMVLVLGLLVTVIILRVRNTHLRQQLTDMRIRELMYSKDTITRQTALLDQIKQQPNRPQAVEQLLHSHESKIEWLRSRYPALTETDIQVLLLLGLGIDNQGILLLLDMSKRTYYKRRQLIAKRMDIATEKLDETAQRLFNPKY